MWKNVKSLAIALVILAIVILIVLGLFWLIPILLIVITGIILFFVVRVSLETPDEPP
jgi:fatty acid desaturase|tara:strand:+ start:1102 stop:1272 length:171 start_codon:yes stop_codon:yes gene_type:complete